MSETRDTVLKILDVVAGVLSKYPNAVTLAASAGIYLVTGVSKAIGMSEEQAKEEWRKELKKLEERPFLEMDFDL